MSETIAAEALDSDLLLRLSETLAAQTGLHYPRARWPELVRGLTTAAGALGCESAAACARRLLAAPLTREQIEVLATHLTIGETYFFRDPKSYEVLEQEILPQLLRAREKTGRRLRIWSAGCCTGEEPYSIAILLARMIPDLSNWNVSILATDIDPLFLSRARRGVYTRWSFRNTAPGIRDAFFRKTREGRFQLDARIRSLVSFGYLNLAEDTYPSVENGTNAMDVIFCRNVLIYFEPAHAQDVLERLSHSLVRGGWLFVSPVEVPQVAVPSLVTCSFPGVLGHRKSGLSGQAPRVARVGVFEAMPSSVPAALPSPRDLSAQGSRLEPEHPAPGPAAAFAVNDEVHQEEHRQAAALYAAGRYAEAAHKALQIIAREPADGGAMALLARAYANQGRLADAMAWCGKALACDRLNAGWHYLFATIAQEQGRANEAAAALRRALYIDHDNALAHFALGNLFRGQRRRKDAERHFRIALSILSSEPQEQILPESEGITAGRLAEIVTSTLSAEGRT